MKYLFVTSFIVLAFLLPSQPVIALDGVVEGKHWLLPECVEDGNCDSCDFIQLMVNWGKGSIPSLSLFSIFMFVLGGFWWLISAGDTEKINRGKQIMIGAVIGIVFALMSYILVTFTIAALSGKDMKEVKIFDKAWDEFSCPG